MHCYDRRVMNTPFCVALVDMSKRQNAVYYLVYFERFADIKTAVRLSGPLAGSVNTLVSREETVRTCNLFEFNGVGVEIFPNSADGLTLTQTENLIQATLTYRKNNDNFAAIQMSVNDLLELSLTNAGQSRVNAAGARLDIPGRSADYAQGAGFAFYAPSLIFNNDDIDIELELAAGAGLANLDFDVVLHEYRTERSSSPQGPFSGCDYVLAACDGERPTHFLIGPDQYLIPERPGVGPAVSTRFPQPGVPAGPAVPPGE